MTRYIISVTWRKVVSMDTAFEAGGPMLARASSDMRAVELLMGPLSSLWKFRCSCSMSAGTAFAAAEPERDRPAVPLLTRFLFVDPSASRQMSITRSVGGRSELVKILRTRSFTLSESLLQKPAINGIAARNDGLSDSGAV